MSVPGPVGRWMGERAFWGKGAFFTKQGRNWSRWLPVCGVLGPGSGTTGGDAAELPPVGLPTSPASSQGEAERAAQCLPQVFLGTVRTGHDA